MTCYPLCKAESRKQKAESRKQKAESRKQKAESRKQKAIAKTNNNLFIIVYFSIFYKIDYYIFKQ